MGLSFVVIDDHAVVRKGIIQILREEFIAAEIIELGSVEEYLKISKQSKPDLIISDISLPGRSGLDLLKQFQTEHPEIPFLMLSMHPEQQYALRAIKSGAKGYLTKETAAEELVIAVKKILSGKKFISASFAELFLESFTSNEKQLPHESLSDREFEVVKLIATGKTVSEIAAILVLSVATVSTYRTRILEKLKVKNNAEIALYAINNQLVG